MRWFQVKRQRGEGDPSAMVVDVDSSVTKVRAPLCPFWTDFDGAIYRALTAVSDKSSPGLQPGEADTATAFREHQPARGADSDISIRVRAWRLRVLRGAPGRAVRRV